MAEPNETAKAHFDQWLNDSGVKRDTSFSAWLDMWLYLAYLAGCEKQHETFYDPPPLEKIEKYKGPVYKRKI